MIEFFGWSYTVCFAICYIPQLVKSFITKKVDDVSLSLFVLSLFGYICALIYAIYKLESNLILLLNYSFGGFCSLLMIILFLLYKKK